MKISKKLWSIILIAVVILIFILVQKFYAKEKAMIPEKIVIRLGVEGQADAKTQGFDVMSHPSGLYFYTAHWDNPEKPGVVRFEKGSNSFEIGNVQIVNGTGDNDFPENGVENWDVIFRVASTKTSSYAEARDNAMALLGRLRAAGWKRYIETSDPRLIGKEAMLYELSEPGLIYSMDSAYTPTIEEWKRIVEIEPVWSFYANGVFVDLTLSYQASTSDAGVYLMDIKISSAVDNYSAYFSKDDDDKKRQWKKYLSDRLEPARKERLMREAKLDPKKYTIDTTYQAPPFEAPDFSAAAGAAH